MSLAGKGAVAIWHDIAEDGRAEFYAWHGDEHMPERAGIPGFLRGRRYVALAGAPEFFNLYETVSKFTVTGPDYLARLNAPTSRTVSAVRHFRNVARSLCEVAASHGQGQGGLIATFRYSIDDAHAREHHRGIAHGLLPALTEAPGVAGCHLLVADEAASAFDTAEQRVRPERNVVPRWILLVESWDDADAFSALCAKLREDRAFERATAKPTLGIYRLQNSRVTLPWSIG